MLNAEFISNEYTIVNGFIGGNIKPIFQDNIGLSNYP